MEELYLNDADETKELVARFNLLLTHECGLWTHEMTIMVIIEVFKEDDFMDSQILEALKIHCVTEDFNDRIFLGENQRSIRRVEHIIDNEWMILIDIHS